MKISIFPEDESSIFIDPNFLLINDNINIKINFVFYCVNNNLKYPYVSYLFEKNNDILNFFKTKINNIKEINNYLIEIKNTYNNYTFFNKNIKYYLDVDNNELYLFCEFKKNTLILNYDKNESIYELNTYDIINYKGVYDIKLSNDCLNFFMLHNYLLFVKNHTKNIKYPTPMSIYKGTKNRYINDIVLFGELKFLLKKNYTYSDYKTSVLESLNKYVENIDYNLVVFKNVDFVKNPKNMKYIIKEKGIYSKDNKLLIKIKNDIINQNSEVKIIDYNIYLNTVHLKVKRNDILENSIGNYIYPYYDTIIENSERIILKYVAFIDELIHEKEMKDDDLVRYFNLDIKNSEKFYYKVTKKENNESFYLKSTNLNSFYLNEYLKL